MSPTSAVWEAFADRLRAFIARRVRGAADVDDILQDVFAKIHAGLGTLKEAAKLEAWLFQVTRRAIRDHARSRSGLRRTTALPEALPGKEAASDVASCLEPMMALLPEEERDLLRLADLDGVPQQGLAARLGVSLTAAKSRIRRARRRLKDAVLDCCRVEWDRRGTPVEYARKRDGRGPCGCP